MVEIKKEITLEGGKKKLFTFKSLKAKEIVQAKRACRVPNRAGGYDVDDDKLSFVMISKMVVEPKITYEEVLELDTFVLKQFTEVMEELENTFLGKEESDITMEGEVSDGQLGINDSEDSSKI